MHHIERSEAKEIMELPNWILLFGRRKVGKTYLIQRYIEPDVYISVRRDGVSYAEGKLNFRAESAEDLFDAIRDLVSDGGCVAVDEFQRLPDSFLDELAILHPSGRVVLSGSSVGVMDSVMGTGSPLLGLVSVYRLGLVRPVDAILSLDGLRPRARLAFSAYLREPWLSSFLRTDLPIERALWEVLPSARYTVPTLIGEVFTESQRRLTQVYEAVIRGLGSGLWRPGDLAHRLQNIGLLNNEGSNYLRTYLKSLVEMGLVSKIPIHGKAKWVAYRLDSQLLETYYYLADRHRTDEVDRPLDDIRHNLRKMISLAVERFIGQLFQQIEGGQLEYSFDPELDFILTKGRKRRPTLVGEVKWGRYTKKDLANFASKVEDWDCRKVLVVPKASKDRTFQGIEVLDVSDLIAMAEEFDGKEERPTY